MFQTVSARDFTSRRRPAKLTAAGGTDGHGDSRQSARPLFARASTRRDSQGDGRNGAGGVRGGRASTTDPAGAAAGGPSRRGRKMRAQSSGARTAASAAEDAAQAELAATPGLLEPMRVELVPVDGVANCYRVAAGMKSRHPPAVIYNLLRDFKGGPAIFRHMDKCTSAPQPDGSFLVVQSVKWRFQLISGKFDLALHCHCDDAARTITYRLANPGFMKAFVGTSTIRSLSPLPHSPPAAASSLPLTVPGTRFANLPQLQPQPASQPQSQPKPLHPSLQMKPLQQPALLQPPLKLHQRLLQLQQAIPLGRFPAQLLAFGRVSVGEPQIEGAMLGTGGAAGLALSRLKSFPAQMLALGRVAVGGPQIEGNSPGMASAAAAAGGKEWGTGADKTLTSSQWGPGRSTDASKLVQCEPSDCGSVIEIVQRVEPAALPLGPLYQFILGHIISSQMRGLFHHLCVEATNIEARQKAEQARLTAAAATASAAEGSMENGASMRNMLGLWNSRAVVPVQAH
ncbi:hypothetical protein CLOP_g18874 [Closterium sp. NIES-67]|nr:hypothetical protein CLOP_g18874 [Closterium sp. NIES-67]